MQALQSVSHQADKDPGLCLLLKKLVLQHQLADLLFFTKCNKNEDELQENQDIAP